MNRLTGTALLLCLPMLARSTPARAQVAAFDGRPVFSEGADLGYYLWKEDDTWRVRWTTKGVMRHFAGSVSAEGGNLKSLKRVDVETERKVLYPGRPGHVFVGPRGRLHATPGRAPVVVSRDQDKIEKDGDNRIVFTARTNDDIDGFDFKTDDKVTALRFVLEIDGRQLPNLVEFGRNNQKATVIPLVVLLRP
jgi:hypothetical protein